MVCTTVGVGCPFFSGCMFDIIIFGNFKLSTLHDLVILDQERLEKKQNYKSGNVFYPSSPF